MFQATKPPKKTSSELWENPFPRHVLRDTMPVSSRMVKPVPERHLPCKAGDWKLILKTVCSEGYSLEFSTTSFQ